MRFSTSLILFAATVTGAFYPITVSATPYGSMASRRSISSDNTNLETQSTADAPNPHDQVDLTKRVLQDGHLLYTNLNGYPLLEELREESKTKFRNLFYKVAKSIRTGQANSPVTGYRQELVNEMWDYHNARIKQNPNSSLYQSHQGDLAVLIPKVQ
ncbi:hypothetical protein BC835DRAFT_1355909 [Cytidiella melzeri]|nr:hypothetical protein BC835DRAFT_1355909 [Cytidiella melzeri]